VIRQGTVADALIAAAASTRGVRTIEHDGACRFFAYGALLAEALRIAGSLRAHGLEPGARVALVVPEVGDFVRAFFGISAAGLLPVPICPPSQAGDLPTFTQQSHHILDASRAAAVVTSPDVARLLDLAGLDRTVATVTLNQLDGRPLAAPVASELDSPALLQFTSGSTSAPKGVVLTHSNVHANVAAIASPDGIDVRPTDVGVSWLPLYHDMGLIGMLLTALYTSNDIVVLSPVLFLKRPTAWLDAISTYRGTVSFAPNFAYELCLKRVKASQIDILDLSSWRVAGCGAEPIRIETLRAFATRFHRAGFRASSFVASYGLAEHSVAVALARHGITVDEVDGDQLIRRSVAVPAGTGSAHVVRLVGCGRAFPNHEFRILDEEGQPARERAVGSIVARGPSVMQGYFEDPAATAEVLRGGWLHTGDLGYIAGGELFVCGRTKDLIIRRGRKYHPPDLESAIAALPGIRASGVVVFGIQRPNEADEVVAVLEARASVARGLVDQVRQRVRETAGLELDYVIVTPPGTVPRTTSGKVRRAETRERFETGSLLAGGETL
jgi:fatty-acyl-CoA synthase